MPTKEQYAKDLEKWKAKNRKWIEDNPEKAKTSQRVRAKKWRESHPDKLRESNRNSLKKWKRAHPEAVRNYRLKQQYGISQKDYIEMSDSQNGKCKACGQVKKLCVDHDHETGRIRGLLCSTCNRVLGFVDDDKKLLYNLIEYLS